MMYIKYNSDGSIKKVNLTDFIMQGDSGIKIYVSIDGLTDDNRDNYSVSVQWKLASGEVIGPVPCSYKASQDAFEVVIEEAETLYEGQLFGSIVLIDLLSNIKYTYPAKFVINPSTFEPNEETNITTAQYANLLNYIKTHGMEIVEINKNQTLLDLWNLIGDTLTFVRVSGNGTFLFSLALSQQGQTDEINFEAEKYSGGITAGQDRFSGTAVPSETVLDNLLKSSGEYFRPYLVTNVPFDLVNNPDLTLADIYARISNKAAIIRLVAIDEWAGINGFYLIKMETIEGLYTIEAERIGMGNAPTVSSASYRFIGNQVDPATYIRFFFDPDNEFYAPYAELKEMPTSLENGVGNRSLQQKQDGTSGTFDFTDKNPHATAVDSSLTGNIAFGGVGDYSTSFGGKSQASGKRATAEGTTTVAKGNYSHSEGSNTVAKGTASHSEGLQTFANNNGAHAEGNNTQALGVASHSEGYDTKASGTNSHAEGYQTQALGDASHAEGSYGQAKSVASHTEGVNNYIGAISSGQPSSGGSVSPSQPGTTPSAGDGSHAEGRDNYVYGHTSHAEGAQNVVSGNYAHASGVHNTVGYDYQVVVGKYNDNKSDTLFEVGNGSSGSPSNAFEVCSDGTLRIPNFNSSGTKIGYKKIKCVNGVLTVID